MPSLDRLALALGRAAAWCFAAIVIVLVYEVVARYACGAPTRRAHEAPVALAAVGFVLGRAFCAAESSHMRIDLLTERRPTLAHWLGGVAGAVHLGGLAYASWRMAERAVWRFSLDRS